MKPLRYTLEIIPTGKDFQTFRIRKYARGGLRERLKKIFHLYGLADAGSRNLETHLVEARRAHPDPRITREAEALTRDRHELVETAIGILVMDEGERVDAGRHAGNADAAGLAGRHRMLHRGRIGVTVREVGRVPGQA